MPPPAMERMKRRWGVESSWRFWFIMLVFSLAGISILFVKQPLYQLLHLNPHASLWIQVPLTLLMYQVLLLFWGGMLGEFRFFWEKEKKLGRWLLRSVGMGTRQRA